MSNPNRYLASINLTVFDASERESPRSAAVSFTIKSANDMFYTSHGSLQLGEVDLSKSGNQIQAEAIMRICEIEGLEIPGVTPVDASETKALPKV